MSYFTVTCPWCGVSYTTGIVGRTPVGSGHRCRENRPCDVEGCESASAFYSVNREFRCGEHLDDVVTVLARSGGSDAVQ